MTESTAEDWERARQALAPQEALPVPGHFARAGAFVLDGALVAVAMFVIEFALGVVLLVLASADVIPSLDQHPFFVSPAPEVFSYPPVVAVRAAVVGLGLAYLPWFWARGGQTPAMSFLGMRVARSDTLGDIGFRVAIVRFVALVVSVVSVVGILWTFFDPRRRGWHDIVAGTVVIAES